MTRIQTELPFPLSLQVSYASQSTALPSSSPPQASNLSLKRGYSNTGSALLKVKKHRASKLTPTNSYMFAGLYPLYCCEAINKPDKLFLQHLHLLNESSVQQASLFRRNKHDSLARTCDLYCVYGAGEFLLITTI